MSPDEEGIETHKHRPITGEVVGSKMSPDEEGIETNSSSTILCSVS